MYGKATLMREKTVLTGIALSVTYYVKLAIGIVQLQYYSLIKLLYTHRQN
jgi:hypothetical protein